MNKKLLAGLAVIIIVLVGGYYGLSYYVFDQVTNIQPECGADFMEAKLDNVPTSFVNQFKKVDPISNAEVLWMASYEDVTFPSRDPEITVAAWYIPSPEASEHVVIVVHGVNGCRRDSTQLIPAALLHRNNFNVLMIDLRNHGDSTVTTGRMDAGNSEYQDVLGAFDYLLNQGFEADDIGLLGNSMGAATSAIAFGAEPDMPALWLDSPYADITDVIDLGIDNAGLPSALVRPGVMQVAALMGVDFTSNSPLEAIQQHNERPILVTHGDADEQVPFESGRLVAENAGPNAIFLFYPDMRHLEAVYVQEDYEVRLVLFFTEHIVNDG